jgi:vitamin B12 transporter
MKNHMKSPFTARAIPAVAISAIFATSAYCQTSQTLSPVLVTAARIPQSARDVLSDTLVITAEELAASGQRTLVDVLQQKRGFEINRNGGPGTVSSVFIRGAANNQSVVLVDGVRIGSSTLGGATWETIPLAQIERVEVVYGPLSSLYGADAIGGVLQIFTKRGDGAPRGTVSAGLGSYATRSLDAGVSGSTSTFRYALQAAQERSDGFSASTPDAGKFTYNPDRDGYTKRSVGAQFSLELAPGQELGMHLLHSALEAQFDAGPGFDDRNEQQLGAYALYAKNKITKDWTSLLQIARSTDQGKTFASYGNSRIDTAQNQFSWQNDLRVGADTLQLVLDRRVEKVDADTAALKRERSTNSVAGSYRLQRGQHSGSIALRNDNNSQFGSHTTGSLDYGYRLSDALRVNLGAGTSFRAPTFNELYYPSFGIDTNKPEKGKNIEAGLHYEAGDSHASAVVYRNRLSDLLVYAPVCPVQLSTHPFGCAYNIDQATLSGVSFSADKTFGSLQLRGALDVQDPRDDTTGKRLPRRARQHGSVALEYAAGSYKAGVESVFSGERYDDGANLNRLGGYGLLNVFASTALARDWSLFGRWNNVTGKNYALSRGYATPGSNLFVGIRYAMQ